MLLLRRRLEQGATEQWRHQAMSGGRSAPPCALSQMSARMRRLQQQWAWSRACSGAAVGAMRQAWGMAEVAVAGCVPRRGTSGV